MARLGKGKHARGLRSMSPHELQKAIRVATEQIRRLSSHIALCEHELKRRGQRNHDSA